MEIVHDQEQHTFLIENPEGRSYMEYTQEGNTVTVIHTVVPDALSGKGIAGHLAGALYSWAKEEGYTLLSDCTYMTHWLSKK